MFHCFYCYLWTSFVDVVLLPSTLNMLLCERKTLIEASAGTWYWKQLFQKFIKSTVTFELISAYFTESVMVFCMSKTNSKFNAGWLLVNCRLAKIVTNEYVSSDRRSWSLLFFKPLPSQFRTNHHFCIKPSKAPQRSVKMKVSVNFYFNVTSWIVGTRRGKKCSSENMADLKEDLSEEILF